MSSYFRLTHHIVFGTSYRTKSIGADIQNRLFDYIGGIVRSRQGLLIQIGGIEDHIHILVNFSPVHALSDCVRDIKANSSRWINELPYRRSRFEWQKGYWCIFGKCFQR